MNISPSFVYEAMTHYTSIRNNLIFNFGRHKGSLLKDVDSDYLKWLVKEGVVRADKNWARLAAAELATRQNPNVKIDISESEPIPVIEDTELVTTKQSEIEWRVFKVTAIAMADIVDNHIREFLLRSDKSQEYAEWAYDLAREVLRMGTNQILVEHPDSTIQELEYLKTKWIFQAFKTEYGKYRVSLESIEKISLKEDDLNDHTID